MTVTVPATTLAGELTLRPWTGEDVESLIEAYRDPTLRRWTRIPVTSEQEAREWLELQQRGVEKGERISFAVDEVTDPRGAVQLVANVVLKLDARAMIAPRSASGQLRLAEAVALLHAP